MYNDDELWIVCESVLREGIWDRAKATGSALKNQVKTLFSRPASNNSNSDDVGDDGLPGTVARQAPAGPTRFERMHETGVNAKAMSLFKSYSTKIQNRLVKIQKLINDGESQKMISEKAKSIYNQKIAQINDIIKQFQQIIQPTTTAAPAPTTSPAPTPATPTPATPTPTGSPSSSAPATPAPATTAAPASPSDATAPSATTTAG